MHYHKVQILMHATQAHKPGVGVPGIRVFFSISFPNFHPCLFYFSVTQNLDYIQNLGFTAIWISPVSQNYEGPRTAYGDPYHGYWMADISQLNSRFGTSDDLKALSAELHKRGMFVLFSLLSIMFHMLILILMKRYLMVDVVVNDVMSTSITPDLSGYLFKEPDQYHPFCWVNYSSTVSEEECWLGDKNVPLPDLNTENPTVVAGFQSWVSNLVQEYSIDGLRIDGSFTLF